MLKRICTIGLCIIMIISLSACDVSNIPVIGNLLSGESKEAEEDEIESDYIEDEYDIFIASDDMYGMLNNFEEMIDTSMLGDADYEYICRIFEQLATLLPACGVYYISSYSHGYDDESITGNDIYYDKNSNSVKLYVNGKDITMQIFLYDEEKETIMSESDILSEVINEIRTGSDFETISSPVAEEQPAVIDDPFNPVLLGPSSRLVFKGEHLDDIAYKEAYSKAFEELSAEFADIYYEEDLEIVGKLEKAVAVEPIIIRIDFLSSSATEKTESDFIINPANDKEGIYYSVQEGTELAFRLSFSGVFSERPWTQFRNVYEGSIIKLETQEIFLQEIERELSSHFTNIKPTEVIKDFIVDAEEVMLLLEESEEFDEELYTEEPIITDIQTEQYNIYKIKDGNRIKRLSVRKILVQLDEPEDIQEEGAQGESGSVEPINVSIPKTTTTTNNADSSSEIDFDKTVVLPKRTSAGIDLSSVKLANSTVMTGQSKDSFASMLQSVTESMIYSFYTQLKLTSGGTTAEVYKPELDFLFNYEKITLSYAGGSINTNSPSTYITGSGDTRVLIHLEHGYEIKIDITPSLPKNTTPTSTVNVGNGKDITQMGPRSNASTEITYDSLRRCMQELVDYAYDWAGFTSVPLTQIPDSKLKVIDPMVKFTTNLVRVERAVIGSNAIEFYDNYVLVDSNNLRFVFRIDGELPDLDTREVYKTTTSEKYISDAADAIVELFKVTTRNDFSNSISFKTQLTSILGNSVRAKIIGVGRASVLQSQAEFGINNVDSYYLMERGSKFIFKIETYSTSSDLPPSVGDNHEHEEDRSQIPNISGTEKLKEIIPNPNAANISGEEPVKKVEEEIKKEPDMSNGTAKKIEEASDTKNSTAMNTQEFSDKKKIVASKMPPLHIVGFQTFNESYSLFSKNVNDYLTIAWKELGTKLVNSDIKVFQRKLNLEEVETVTITYLDCYQGSAIETFNAVGTSSERFNYQISNGEYTLLFDVKVVKKRMLAISPEAKDITINLVDNYVTAQTEITKAMNILASRVDTNRTEISVADISAMQTAIARYKTATVSLTNAYTSNESYLPKNNIVTNSESKFTFYCYSYGAQIILQINFKQ